MKRLFGLLLLLAAMLFVHWPTFDPAQVSDPERWLPLIVGGGCIVGIIVVYVEITVKGLRDLKRHPPTRDE